MLPYQLVPSATNVKMSIFPAAAVMVGAPAELHLTLVNVAVPLPVVAACLRSRIKLLPAVAVGIVNTHAVDAVSVAVWTVPLFKANVFVATTVPSNHRLGVVYDYLIDYTTIVKCSRHVSVSSSDRSHLQGRSSSSCSYSHRCF